MIRGITALPDDALLLGGISPEREPRPRVDHADETLCSENFSPRDLASISKREGSNFSGRVDTERGTMSGRGRQRRDILEDLEKEGKTLDAVLLAWSIVEMHCSGVLLRAYGLSTQNPKSEWLTKLRISSKLRLLKRMGLLSDKDFNVIQRFKEKRDGLAHRNGLFFPNYTDAQKRELRNMAIDAADVTHDLFDKALKSQSPMFGAEHWIWKELEKLGTRNESSLDSLAT